MKTVVDLTSPEEEFHEFTGIKRKYLIAEWKNHKLLYHFFNKSQATATDDDL